MLETFGCINNFSQIQKCQILKIFYMNLILCIKKNILYKLYKIRKNYGIYTGKAMKRQYLYFIFL